MAEALHHPLRVVCIGGWGHGFAVFPELLDRPEAELVAFARGYPGEDLSGFTDLPLFAANPLPIHDDHRAMLAELRPDVAIVSTRPDQIAPLATDAARAGCHLILEKPLALSVEALDVLAATVAERRVQVLAMHTMRSRPAFIAAREVCRSGALGRVALVQARKSYRWGVRPPWFAQRAMYGGTLPWVGIHGLDMIRFVTGLDCVAIDAAHGNQAHPDFPGCEDFGQMQLELEHGALGSVSVDILRPDGAQVASDDWLRVVGTQGSLEANGSRGTCEVLNAGGAWSPPLPEPARIYRDFLLSLLGRAEPCITTGESFALSRWALRARDAADARVRHGSGGLQNVKRVEG